MSMIKKSGYYLSEPFHYEDLHAGNIIKKEVYTAYWFLEGDCVMTFSKSNNKKFTKIEFLKENRRADVLKNDKNFTITFDKGSKFEVKETFSIISSDVIKKENGMKYHFIPW